MLELRSGRCEAKQVHRCALRLQVRTGTSACVTLSCLLVTLSLTLGPMRLSSKSLYAALLWTSFRLASPLLIYILTSPDKAYAATLSMYGHLV